jgi:hypothetical protein
LCKGVTREADKEKKQIKKGENFEELRQEKYYFLLNFNISFPVAVKDAVRSGNGTNLI